ncbi:hypothetical protein Micbo1qcDRAFT_165556, partial [Microdochium bolleyi]
MGASGSKSVAFNPRTDIPPLQDKVILVTGGTSGLGKQSILELARHEPREIWLGARNATKAQETIAAVKAEVPGASIRFVQMDLGSFASIRAAARTVLDGTDRLDILLLNAGIMAVPAATTEEGYEVQFGTNHMGHALLTKLLLEPRLLKTAGSRVVLVSSAGHAWAPKDGIAFDTLKSPAAEISTGLRYGQSKLANALYARELARRFPQVTAVSLHPGVVRTSLGDTASANSWIARVAVALFSTFAGVDVQTGALNQLWAATAEGVVSGEYYVPVGVPGRAKPFVY